VQKELRRLRHDPLELRKEFDGVRLVSARQSFAAKLLEGKPHNEMNQEILTFFEDMGMLCRRKLLDEEMLWDTFGHFVQMWWSACRDYVEKEQRNMHGSTAIFADLKHLVQQMRKWEEKKKGKIRAELEPPRSDIEYFLRTEAGRPLAISEAA
jgi:hypothetical protein